MAPYVRTVKTASGATAVQVVYSSRRGSRDIEHIGSAHDDVELELLKAAARQRMAAGQGELDLGLDAEPAEAVDRGGGPLAITSSQMGHLWDTLVRGFEVLGFDEAMRLRWSGGCPCSPNHRGRRRSRRPVLPIPAWGRMSLVLYDVSTLYFETDAGDGFGEPGFSKERRLEPQITIGLLTNESGFGVDGERVRGQPRRDDHDAAGDP